MKENKNIERLKNLNMLYVDMFMNGSITKSKLNSITKKINNDIERIKNIEIEKNVYIV
jgi:hypothetical protein